jgi:DNA-directed RNA polymerase specialized sigma54-like protein
LVSGGGAIGGLIGTNTNSTSTSTSTSTSSRSSASADADDFEGRDSDAPVTSLQDHLREQLRGMRLPAAHTANCANYRESIAAAE